MDYVELCGAWGFVFFGCRFFENVLEEKNSVLYIQLWLRFQTY